MDPRSVWVSTAATEPSQLLDELLGWESRGLWRRCFTGSEVVSLPRTELARPWKVDHWTPQLGAGGFGAGCFVGGLLPFLVVVVLFGLLLFRWVGVGCADRVLVEEELGRGRFILLAVEGEGGNACSSDEVSFFLFCLAEVEVCWLVGG